MKFSSMVFASLVAIPLVACGGGQSTGTTGGVGSGGTGTGPAAAGDLALAIEAQPIGGVAFTPEALGRPALPQIQPKKKLTLDKHRAEFNAAKADEVEIKGQVLATRLFADARAETDTTKQQALQVEAFTVLKTVREKLAGKADINTLRMLGFHAFTQQDLVTAASVFAELATRFASDPAALEFKTYQAWAALRQHDYAAANAALASFSPSVAPATASEDAAIAIAEASYAAGWARWGTGASGAFDALAMALQGWKSAGSRPAVESDLMLIAAHTGALVDGVVDAITKTSAKDALYGNLFKVSNAYAGAGEFADASTLIDRAIAAGGASVPPADLAKLHFAQAQYAMRLGQPADAATHITAALAIQTPKADLVAGALGMAKLFHTIFATSLDDSYYKPTKALYLAVAVNGDAAPKAEAEGLTAQLDQTKTNSKAGSGKHDISVIKPLIALRDLDITACFEDALLREPTLAGDIGLSLDVAATGVVSGATTTPPSGEQGLAKVAGCVETRARAWKLPARTMPGQTTITATYQLKAK